MLEKIFLVFLCIVSAFLFFITFNFETLEMDKYSLGPAFFPKLICIFLFITAFTLLILSRKNKNNSINKFKDFKYSILTILYFFIYLFLIEKIGYLISTILFMVSIVYLLKNKKILLNITLSILFSIVIYLIFSKIFNVSLPKGIFI